LIVFSLDVVLVRRTIDYRRTSIFVAPACVLRGFIEVERLRTSAKTIDDTIENRALSRSQKHRKNVPKPNEKSIVGRFSSERSNGPHIDRKSSEKRAEIDPRSTQIGRRSAVERTKTHPERTDRLGVRLGKPQGRLGGPLGENAKKTHPG
jgi:hypothetical protein